MAIIDTYADPAVAAGELGASLSGGSPVLAMQVKVNVDASDDAGSTYRVARMPATARILKMDVSTTGMTGASDYDLGLYVAGKSGAVKSVDIFAQGLDFSLASRYNDAMSNVAIADFGKSLNEYLNETVSESAGQYDITLTANNAGSANGSIIVNIIYAAF